ncbi:MAG: cysteine methyltransferase [Spirochaetes bacterium]|nr:MAG: cysteine methyltransferase [Spirochaetota bacterium]
MRSRIDKRIQNGLKSSYLEGDSSLLKDLEQQLDEYFSKKRTDFNLPLLTVGTDFQNSVWEALQEIKYGQTWTYSDLAAQVGKSEAVRAVGSANGANAISIIIPCHRIIGKGDSLGGYAGGLNTKRRLLELESQPLLDWGD